LLQCHPDAAIRDRELDPVLTVHHLSHPQRDLTLFRELAGIAQEIEQNLLEPHGIRVEFAQILLRFDDEVVLVLPGKLSRGADDLIDEPCQIHRLEIEVEFAGFDLREVQYLVDEAQEVGSGCIYTAVPAPFPCRSAPRW
jgi:hypothetical protein